MRRSKIRDSGSADGNGAANPVVSPEPTRPLPRFILAIDGSYSEVPVRNGYPGAKVGYCTVASVLIDLDLVSHLDRSRPIDPVQFRETEKATAIDAALPGSNVVTRRQTSSRASFREELFDRFAEIIVDEDDRLSLLDTFEDLLLRKPTTRQERCPYSDSDGCTETLNISKGSTSCPGCGHLIFSTDSLRIHERFNELGTNGEAFGLVMQVWERLLLVHLLRCFEQRDLLKHTSKLAFFLDGPLAVFGPPAWLSSAINAELKRINSKVREGNGKRFNYYGYRKERRIRVSFR